MATPPGNFNFESPSSPGERASSVERAPSVQPVGNDEGDPIPDGLYEGGPVQYSDAPQEEQFHFPHVPVLVNMGTPNAQVQRATLAVVPRHNRAYMIRHRATGRYVSFSEGRVVIRDPTGTTFGRHWICEEESGYYLLYHLASGRYLTRGTEAEWFPLGLGNYVELRREIMPLRTMRLIFRLTPRGTWQIWISTGNTSGSVEMVSVDDDGELVSYDPLDPRDHTEWDFIPAFN
ncbi:hypothetical protein HJFPF1_08134 [Paramyrothecium foliicola]|nr:hypothetical protein HJFPF1_08134 [Paramyrothecium foliicola]